MKTATDQIKVVIKAQCHEWYGCEDNIGEAGKGRYKPKGGEDFVVNVPAQMYWNGADDLMMQAFNERMDVDGEFFKYTAIEVARYYQPTEIELDFS